MDNLTQSTRFLLCIFDDFEIMDEIYSFTLTLGIICSMILIGKLMYYLACVSINTPNIYDQNVHGMSLIEIHTQYIQPRTQIDDILWPDYNLGQKSTLCVHQIDTIYSNLVPLNTDSGALDCHICYESVIDPNRRNTFYPCGHSGFCITCIQSTSTSNDKIICPLCKTLVDDIMIAYI